jgi:hypothetical protein
MHISEGDLQSVSVLNHKKVAKIMHRVERAPRKVDKEYTLACGLKIRHRHVSLLARMYRIRTVPVIIFKIQIPDLNVRVK